MLNRLRMPTIAVVDAAGDVENPLQLVINGVVLDSFATYTDAFDAATLWSQDECLVGMAQHEEAAVPVNRVARHGDTSEGVRFLCSYPVLGAFLKQAEPTDMLRACADALIVACDYVSFVRGDYYPEMAVAEYTPDVEHRLDLDSALFDALDYASEYQIRVFMQDMSTAITLLTRSVDALRAVCAPFAGV